MANDTTNHLVPKVQVINKDFVCRQALEVADLARNSGQLAIALEALGMIAEIQGMLNEPA
jgi:hypothetical protein